MTSRVSPPPFPGISEAAAPHVPEHTALREPASSLPPVVPPLPATVGYSVQAPDLKSEAARRALSAVHASLSNALTHMPVSMPHDAVRDWLAENAFADAVGAFSWAALLVYAEAGEAQARVWVSDFSNQLHHVVSAAVARLHANPSTRELANHLRVMAHYLDHAPEVSREQALTAVVAIAEDAPAIAEPLSAALSFAAATRNGEAALAFCDAALFGSAAKSEGAAAIAGQLTSGVTPLVGQLVSARELLDTLRGFARGERQGAEVLLSVAALVPAFEFLRAEKNVLSAKQLRVAFEVLGTGADEGLAVLRKALPAAEVAQLEAEVRALNAARVEIMARIEKTANTAVGEAKQTWLKIRNGLADQLEPDDFVGALRESRGIGPTWAKTGQAMNHGKKAERFLDRLSARLKDVEDLGRTRAENEALSLTSALHEYRKRALLLLGK